MKASRVINCLALLLLTPAFGNSQRESLPQKTATGSISGRVTVEGKPRAAVRVALENLPTSSTGERGVVATTETDEEGKYLFREVSAGTYRVDAIAPDTVPLGMFTRRIDMGVILADGQAVEGVNIELIKGGVITGRVVNSEGWPLAGLLVRLDRFDSRGVASQLHNVNSRILRGDTDDRGVYRIFGLPAGKYLVSVGEDAGTRLSVGPRGIAYSRVYHPDTPDRSKATSVELTEGKELGDIDIKLTAPLRGYAISGSIVDADTKRPLQGIKVSYGSGDAGYYAMSTDSRVTPPTGEFRVEDVPRGRYSFFVGADNQSGLYSEPISVEVTDDDVSGVEILAKRGGSISGRIIIEGTRDPAILSRISELRLTASLPHDYPSIPKTYHSAITPDGTFHFRGLQPGVFRLNPNEGPAFARLKFMRTELDGVIQTRGIQLGAGEQITGARVVLAYATGSIQGQVLGADIKALEGGSLSAFAQLSGDVMGFGSRLDVRGAFFIQKLVPGQYEITVTRFSAGPQGTVSEGSRTLAKQTVTVTSDRVTQITISIKPEAIK